MPTHVVLIKTYNGSSSGNAATLQSMSIGFYSSELEDKVAAVKSEDDFRKLSLVTMTTANTFLREEFRDYAIARAGVVLDSYFDAIRRHLSPRLNAAEQAKLKQLVDLKSIAYQAMVIRSTSIPPFDINKFVAASERLNPDFLKAELMLYFMTSKSIDYDELQLTAEEEKAIKANSVSRVQWCAIFDRNRKVIAGLNRLCFSSYDYNLAARGSVAVVTIQDCTEEFMHFLQEQKKIKDQQLEIQRAEEAKKLESKAKEQKDLKSEAKVDNKKESMEDKKKDAAAAAKEAEAKKKEEADNAAEAKRITEVLKKNLADQLRAGVLNIGQLLYQCWIHSGNHNDEAAYLQTIRELLSLKLAESRERQRKTGQTGVPLLSEQDRNTIKTYVAPFPDESSSENRKAACDVIGKRKDYLITNIWENLKPKELQDFFWENVISVIDKSQEDIMNSTLSAVAPKS